jgi:hypothetical protein
MIDNIAVGLRVACALVGWAFVYRYMKTNWSDSHAGRMMMGLATIIALFMTLVSTSLLFGLSFPHWFTFGMFTLLLALEIYMHIVFTHEQKKDRSDQWRSDHPREVAEDEM